MLGTTGLSLDLTMPRVTDVSVVVASHGTERWKQLGERAAASALYQTDDLVVVHQPDGSVASARNEGALRAKHPWIVFLDADDELENGYVEAMRRTIGRSGARDRLFTPRVRYVGAGGRMQPAMFHREMRPEQGNWLVIGTAVEKRLFKHVGGFEDRWPIYEDWALFARMQVAGATVVRVPDAVYRAYRNPRGRNHSLGRTGKVAAHERIYRAVFEEPPIPALE